MASPNNQDRVTNEIKAILEEQDDGMTADEVAHRFGERGRYRKKDGSPMKANQIRARVSKRKHLFERKGKHGERRIFLRRCAS